MKLYAVPVPNYCCGCGEGTPPEVYTALEEALASDEYDDEILVWDTAYGGDISQHAVVCCNKIGGYTHESFKREAEREAERKRRRDPEYQRKQREARAQARQALRREEEYYDQMLDAGLNQQYELQKKWREERSKS